MKTDFDKIMLIIENPKNERKHLDAIYRIIKNFELKWKKHSGMQMEDFVFRMYVSADILLTKLS